MNRTIAISALLAWVALWAILVVAAPWTLSDSNKFFAGFVNQEFLSFMGVVVTITLASAANLYIELNKLQDKEDRRIFVDTKRDVRHSAYTLIGALAAAVFVVILKPLVDCGERYQAAMNGVAILIILVSIMVLLDLTQAAFNLDPRGAD